MEKIKDGIYAFTPRLTTALGTIWSRTGMGFHITQKHCKCNLRVPSYCKDSWRTVLTGKKFTTGAESRYVPVEGEALAVAWALGKSRHFTLGNDKLIVLVDHKPLLKILGDRELVDIKNPRILNLKQKKLSGTRAGQRPPRHGCHVKIPRGENRGRRVMETLGTSQEANMQTSGRRGRR